MGQLSVNELSQIHIDQHLSEVDENSLLLVSCQPVICHCIVKEVTNCKPDEIYTSSISLYILQYRTRSAAELRYILQRRKERADHTGFPEDYVGKPPSFAPDNPPDYSTDSDGEMYSLPKSVVC